MTRAEDHGAIARSARKAAAQNDRASRTRRCTAKTKKGTRCSRPPMKGGYVCVAHAPEDVKVSRGFGGVQPGAGRPPTPRAVDVIRERIEANIDAVIEPLWEALKAERAVVVGNGPTAHVQFAPDYATHIAAARELLDRGYGRPKQVSEISAEISGRHEIEIPDTDERRAKVLELLSGAMNGDGH